MLVANVNFIVIAVFLMFCCDQISTECQKLTTCSCKLPDGQILDISNLRERVLIAEKDQHSYYFYPCRNDIVVDKSIKPNSECSKPPGVSLCVHIDPQETLALGTVESMTINPVARSDSNFVLIFSHKSQTRNIVTNIFVSYCDNQCQPKLTAQDPIPSTNPGSEDYVLNLVIPRVHHGLSVGSVLVIIFFVLSGMYFIGGALILKLLRGATGWEMLPNHEFWCELPSLVRDGIAFTFNCCRVDSYDRI